MFLDERIAAFSTLGAIMTEYIDTRKSRFSASLEAAVQEAVNCNYWFTEENVHRAMRAVANKMLDGKILLSWTSKYLILPNHIPKTIGLITAGNIPLVGFHDLLCVLIAGDRARVKLSSKDAALMKALCGILFSIEPRFAEYVDFIDRIPDSPDAVIATGSNNSSRYFEAVYGNIPRIIRRNRYSLAALSGTESDEDLALLGQDIFDYFGLGCRNVSRLIVPVDYSFDPLFKAIEGFGKVMKHEGYRNCFRYIKAKFDLLGEDYLSNGFVLLTKNTNPAWLASVNYTSYRKIEEVTQFIHSEKDRIQCLVSNLSFEGFTSVPFGDSQSPEIDDYADGADTLDFLLNLR
ncbi:MAG: hypothetical protein LBC98_08035 [Prevotellaceae bacterium]|nr:hypothetical protein [Prevotellaceae bacterium]